MGSSGEWHPFWNYFIHVYTKFGSSVNSTVNRLNQNQLDNYWIYYGQLILLCILHLASVAGYAEEADYATKTLIICT